MSGNSSPLIQTLNPERWVGWSMDFIGAGYTGLVVKNGRLVRTLSPGRHFSFALPLLEQCQLVLVDGKIRNLDIISQGDFLSHDQYLINVSLSVMYQVVDAKRVALEMQIAQASRPDVQPPPVQQVNIISGRDPQEINPSLGATLEATSFAIEGQPAIQPSLPMQDKPVLAPTVLAQDIEGGVARLVHRSSGAISILSTTPFTIGREPNNSLVLEDALCSRHHARILQQTDSQGTVRYQLMDVGSSNGTFISGQRLAPNQPCWLASGTIIRIGSQEWMFEV